MNHKKSLKLIIALSLSVFLLGCLSSKINQENYAKIQNGMTMEEVKAILGEPTESNTTGISVISGTAATWKSSDGASINIKFLNDKVKLKSFTEK
jgi:hypothetical protein